MKKINAFLVALVALFAVSLNAGAQSQKETVEFNPHWYFDGKVGGQYTLGDAKFMDLLSPNAQVGIGYNFNPVLGLRLSANAWQSKGGWKESVDLPHSPYKWTYVAPQLDLMFNLSNLFCGFNPNRLVDVSVFGGIAANIGLSNKQMNENYDAVGKNYYDYDMMPDPHWAVTNGEPFGTYNWTGTKVRPFGHFGVDVDFKVSDRVKVGVEGSANVGSDKYNSKGTNCADWYFNALVGV
ncbi:MAG: OmpA family protein, partial [Prevotellaceae bacterium]|nr:OmpA family protein [Prevotellaceae bacterium]